MKRPLLFKLDAFRYFYNGYSAIESFRLAGDLNYCTLSGCMTNKSYASSYMSDDIRRVLRDKLDQGNQQIIDYLNKYHIDIQAL
jgi:hypothetical protein